MSNYLESSSGRRPKSKSVTTLTEAERSELKDYVMRETQNPLVFIWNMTNLLFFAPYSKVAPSFEDQEDDGRRLKTGSLPPCVQ